jgi:hypothetical protein
VIWRWALELFDQLKATTDPAKQVELGKRIHQARVRQPVDDWHRRAVPSIAVVKETALQGMCARNAVAGGLDLHEPQSNLDPSPTFFFKEINQAAHFTQGA